MSKNEDKQFLIRQASALDRLLIGIENHPLMGPPLREKRDEFLKKAAGLPDLPPKSRTVVGVGVAVGKWLQSSLRIRSGKGGK